MNAFDQGETRTTVIVIDGTRVGDVRTYDGQIVQSVISRWGTGGGNVPAIYSFDSLSSNSMKSSNPNSGCREVDLSKTLDTAALNPSANQGGIAIYSIREDAKADNFSATTTDTSLALQSLQPSPQSHHAQIFIAEPAVIAPTLSASNNPSRSPQSAEVTAQIDAMVRATAVVRRLTPTECERLQGFPDGWTDGQADSHRYKQMGNAVTVNVIEWIGAQL